MAARRSEVLPSSYSHSVVETESICELWSSSPKGSTKQIGAKDLPGTKCFEDRNTNQMYIVFRLSQASRGECSGPFHSHSLSGKGSILVGPWRTGLGGAHKRDFKETLQSLEPRLQVALSLTHLFPRGQITSECITRSFIWWLNLVSLQAVPGLCHDTNYSTKWPRSYDSLFPTWEFVSKQWITSGKFDVIVFHWPICALCRNWFVSDSSRHTLRPLFSFLNEVEGNGQ